jgi:hypothetical protein
MQDSELEEAIQSGSPVAPRKPPRSAPMFSPDFWRMVPIRRECWMSKSGKGSWWPKVANEFALHASGNVAGGGNLDGFLGLRRHKGGLQLQVEYNGIHGMNSAYQVVKIVWEGGAPQPEAARAFFIPVSRTDGTARYLVVAVEVGNGTGERWRERLRGETKGDRAISSLRPGDRARGAGGD